MKLHLDKQLFSDAITAASQRFNIPEIYIEKDYWVTVALFEIFHSAMASEAVFKGGTALSKCHKLIERFSEDIDIVLFGNLGDTDSQRKSKITLISKKVGEVIPEIEMVGITNKKGQIRKTVHEYEKHGFEGNYGQVREHIVLEVTWLGNSEPWTTAQVSSYIADLMQITSQQSLISAYGLEPFPVQVLSVERTLCEKIMSMVRFSFTENPISDLSNKIRHIYDIHFILKEEKASKFFNSLDFDQMIEKVGQDDKISFRNNNSWLSHHPSSALIFTEPEQTWDKIKNAYRTQFKELVIGELPEESDLVTTLQVIGKRLKQIRWEMDQ